MSHNAFITIFTPTYNRLKLLYRLYDSILNINYDNFEWLIVDDGSTDGTKAFFDTIAKDSRFSIRYIRQENGGKHTAINRGVEEAEGELFFIIDSDDFLPQDSLVNINNYYAKIRDNTKIAGIVGRKKIINNDNFPTYAFENHEFVCSAFDFKYKLNYVGDMAEVIRTDILRKYPFPVFENENFVTESLVWFRISEKYDFLYFDKSIYYCEYQEDGLTDNYWRLLKKNPKGSLLYYQELLKNDITKEQKFNILKTIKSIAFSNGYGFFGLFRILGIYNFFLCFRKNIT